MLYQLPDGRTVEMSIYEYLTLSDEEINSLVGYNHGAEINNPKYGSIITKPDYYDSEDEDFREKDIPDVPDVEKFFDQDYSYEEE